MRIFCLCIHSAKKHFAESVLFFFYLPFPPRQFIDGVPPFAPGCGVTEEEQGLALKEA